MGLKRSDVFQSKYVGKGDVEHPVQVVIASVNMEEIEGDNGTQDKAVIHFEKNRLKPLILNSGNWAEIETAYGEDTDEWVGNTIEVYHDPSVQFKGKRVGGVRVRIPSGAASPSAPKSDTTGSMMFGPAWASALDAKIKAANGNIADLRTFLKGVHVDAEKVIDGDPMNWPRSFMDECKQWLDALVNVPF